MKNLFNVYVEYIDILKLSKRPTTMLQIERKFKLHILKHFSSNINQIQKEQYFNWCNYIRNLNYSDSFNKCIYSILSNFFNYLNEFYNVENLPKKYGYINTYTIKKEKTIKTWDIKTYKKFISNVENQNYHLLFNLLFYTGIRKGELLALTFNDLKGDYLIINKTITKELFNGKRLITQPKTKNSIRTIQIDYLLKKEILSMKKYYNTKYKNFNNNFFICGGDKPISCTQLERKKNYYCEIANVPKIRIHDFRHSHATMLYEKNVKIKYIQARLGHSSIDTTINTYVHNSKSYEKKVIKSLLFSKIL